MTEYLRVVYMTVTESSTKEVMGALMVGLVVALLCYGACLLGRKRTADPLPFLCGLFFLVSVLSIALGAGHSRSKAIDRYSGFTRNASNTNAPGGPRSLRPGEPGSRSDDRIPASFGGSLLLEADADGNGKLTAEEATAFIKAADLEGKGWVDSAAIDRARRKSRSQAINIR